MVREGVFLLLLFGWLGLLLTPVAASEEPVYLLILGEPETFSQTFAPASPLNQRQVGFATMLYTLQASPEQLLQQVNAALDKAEQTGYPVMFHCDDWNFPPRWEDPELVEWTDFPAPGEQYGPLAKRRWINWGSWIVANAPPNFESPKYKEWLASRLLEGVARPIARRLRKWRSEGREYLFAGLVLGWETGFYNVLSFDPNNRPKAGEEVFQDDEAVWTGYAALTARGYNAAKLKQLATEQGRSEKEVFYDQMMEVLHDHAEFMALTCRRVGVPGNRLYTHFAAARTFLEAASEPDIPARSVVGKESPLLTMLKASPQTLAEWQLHGIMTPLWVAVNPYSRPGATAAYDFADPVRTAEAFKTLGKPAWGAVELEVMGSVRDTASCKLHLEELESLGAKTICLFGWWETADSQFSVQSTGAVQAMKEWLAGE